MKLQDLFSEHARRPPDEPFDTQCFPTHGGVYALADDNGTVIRLSHAANLRRIVGKRLAGAADMSPKQVDLRPITAEVWWEPTYSQFETVLRFHESAYRLYPGAHRKLCPFGPAWFAVLDMSDRCPQWLAANDPFAGRSACVGPFARRSRCEAFVRDLQDLFSLCRYHEILQQTPHGEACAYFDMGLCPAPCDGSISFETYRGMLQESIDMLFQDAQAVAGRLNDRMSAAAAERRYESAARFKRQLQMAARLHGDLDGRHRRIEELQYLIVQRGAVPRSVRAFLVNQGTIEIRPDVALQHLEATLPDWLDGLVKPAPQSADQTLAMERLWLVNHFLLKKEAAGAYLTKLQAGNPDAVERIREAFNSPAPADRSRRTRP